MNLLFAINRKFTDLLCVCLRSVAKNGGAEHYDAYILHSDLTEEDQAEIRSKTAGNVTCRFLAVVYMHWRRRRNRFPRGGSWQAEGLTEEERRKVRFPARLRQKGTIRNTVPPYFGAFLFDNCRHSSSDPANAGPPSPRGKELRLRRETIIYKFFDSLQAVSPLADGLFAYKKGSAIR